MTLLERASQYLDNPPLGLRMGQTTMPRPVGTLAFPLRPLPTLGAALQKLQRYQRLACNRKIRLEYMRLAVLLRHGCQPARCFRSAVDQGATTL